MEGGVADPLERPNRAFHSFNKGVDTILVRPLSKGYGYVVPQTIKHVVNNELRYVSLPGSFANSVLQGDVERAGDTLARFVVNGTMGGLGALDPATEMNIPEHDEDFGQTLAVWGVGAGPYVELPLLGPTTLRHLAGRVVDAPLDPLSYIDTGVSSTAISLGKRATTIVDARYRFGPAIDEALYEVPDSYVTVKNLYLQRRKNAILNGDLSGEALPEIFQDDDF